MPKEITVEIVSDHVCPWCYIGKKRLEQAIALRPELDIKVVWRPFQLSPDMPPEGRDRKEHFSEIFGEQRAQQIMGSMQSTGEEEGIAFQYKEGARSPNTLLAHALMMLASDAESIDQNEIAEKLFHAHHVACDDIGDIKMLVKIAVAAGMDEAFVREKLSVEAAEVDVKNAIQDSVQRGVSGVPFFIIDGRYGISGAQPADTLAAAFEQVVSGDAAASA